MEDSCWTLPNELQECELRNSSSLDGTSNQMALEPISFLKNGEVKNQNRTCW